MLKDESSEYEYERFGSSARRVSHPVSRAHAASVKCDFQPEELDKTAPVRRRPFKIKAPKIARHPAQI